jgi:hypothetical protein
LKKSPHELDPPNRQTGFSIPKVEYSNTRIVTSLSKNYFNEKLFDEFEAQPRTSTSTKTMARKKNYFLVHTVFGLALYTTYISLDAKGETLVVKSVQSERPI